MLKCFQMFLFQAFRKGIHTSQPVVLPFVGVDLVAEHQRKGKAVLVFQQALEDLAGGGASARQEAGAEGEPECAAARERGQF